MQLGASLTYPTYCTINTTRNRKMDTAIGISEVQSVILGHIQRCAESICVDIHLRCHLVFQMILQMGKIPFSFHVLLAMIMNYRQVESSKTTSGITSSIPKLSTPRYDIRSQSSAVSLLSVTSCLLLRPKKVLAYASQPNGASILQSSIVPVIETMVVANDEESILNSFVSGAATRVSKELILHPIDTVRARLQKAPDPTNPSASVSGIKQEGLFDNLYDGLLPALVGGVPAGALFFGVKDYSKKKLRKMGLGKQESTVLSVMLTNVPYWVVRTPSEVLKTRRQIRYDNSSSVGEMIGKMVQQEGGILQALASTYDSYPSNFAYAIPADIVKFVACKIHFKRKIRLPSGTFLIAL